MVCPAEIGISLYFVYNGYYPTPHLYEILSQKKSKDMAKPEKSKNQVVPYMDGHLVWFTQ